MFLLFYFWLFIFITGLKILLIPTYHSTDFEVHRNWLAITYNLPIEKWYYENTNQWTLDYPPFFAYFEWFLARIGKYVDPEMLKINNFNYASENTKIFQRFTVISSDLIYVIGVKLCLDGLNIKGKSNIIMGSGLLLSNIGLIFVDHIHFQYNGFLFGILLLSIAAILRERYLLSAFLFASLINFKHIFLYIAPAFGVFLLRFYCIQDKNLVINFIKLVTVTLICFVLSFGPFINHIPQVISRLFPFKRGLTHAYWAPNFWALYNFADKIIAVVNNGLRGSGINTGGLVQDYKHEILPEITPLVTFVLTGIFMIPCLIKLLFCTNQKDSKLDFLRAIVICSCTSFMFGWHVHEKAILMVIIPLTLLAVTNIHDAEFGFFLWFVGHYSLHPLLHQKEFLFIKYPLILAYQLVSYDSLRYIYPNFRVKIFEKLYFFMFLLLVLYQEILQYPLILNLNQKLPFLPLLLTSFNCGLGILYFYIKYYYSFLKSKKTSIVQKTNTKKRKSKKEKLK